MTETPPIAPAPPSEISDLVYQVLMSGRLVRQSDLPAKVRQKYRLAVSSVLLAIAEEVDDAQI